MKLKKAMLALVCALALVVGSVMGTMAYLQDQTQVVQNTFTVGKVGISLDEANVDVYGVVTEGRTETGNEYKLIPGHKYAKDPTVHVDADSENAWLFVKVENGISAIEAAGDTTIAAQMEVNGWTIVDGETNVYAYKDIVVKDADVTVFSNFTLKGDAAVADYATAKINITAYAVQVDGFTTAQAAWDATYGA